MEFIIQTDFIPDVEGAKKAGFPELVRCKDCRFWQDNNGGYPNPDCPWGKDETPDPYDFCSFGEPKDGDDE